MTGPPPVFDGLKERLVTPELVQVFMTTFQAEVNKLQAERTQVREAKERDYEKVVRDLEKLVEALAAGVGAASVKDRINTLEARKASLAKELGETASDPIRIRPSMARMYAEKVAGLETALNDPAIKPEAAEILRAMITKIELTPRVDEPGLAALPRCRASGSPGFWTIWRGGAVCLANSSWTTLADRACKACLRGGKLIQNAFVESFNGGFRDECLNEEWFANLAHARAVIEAWRIHHNTSRPHSALGYLTPEAYLRTRAASPELRIGSTQPPLSTMINQENSQTTWP